MSTESAQNFAFQNNSKLGVSEAALYLKTTPSTLRRLENDGKIKSERLPNGYRQYSFGDVVALKRVLEEKASFSHRRFSSSTATAGPVMQHPCTLAPRPLGGSLGTGQLLHATRPQPQIQSRTDMSVPQIKSLRKLAYAGLAVCLILTLGVGFRIFGGRLSSFGEQASLGGSSNDALSNVLGEQTGVKNYEFHINIPSVFNEAADFKKGLTTTTATAGSVLFTGVAQIQGLKSIDTTTETSLEKALDITGDVVSPTGGGLNNVVISKIKGTSFGDIAPEEGYILMGDGSAWQSVSTEEITALGEISTGTWAADPIEIGSGGTGLTTFATGDMIYASAADTLAALNIGTEGQALVVTGGIPAWADLNLTSGYFAQGGNSYGVAGVLGTTDAYGMQFITNNTTRMTLTSAGSLSFNDNTLLNLSSIAHDDTAPQGFILPQGASLASPSSGVGYLAYDTSTDRVKVYTGSAWADISGASTTLQEAYVAGNEIQLSAGEGNLRVYNDGGNEMLFLQEATGMVGIGTTNPGYKLEVIGTSRISGATIIEGGLDLSLSGITNAGTILGATGLTSSGIVTFSDLSTGIVHSDFSGRLTSSAVNLTNGDVSGTLPIARGGTNLTSYTLGDMIYASGASVLSALTAGGDGEVLVMSGGVPDWGTITNPEGICPHCVVDNPNGTQTITAQQADITPLIIKPAALPEANIFQVTDSTGTANYIKVDKDGNVVLGDSTAFGDFLVGPAGTDPIAITPTAEGAAAKTGTITTRDLTDLRTWYFPNASGDVCTSAGNCAGQAGSFGGVGITGYLTKFDADYTLGISALFQDGSDNIGIGTTLPGHKLDVNGTFGVVGLASFDGNVDIAGNLGVGTTSGGSALTVVGDSDLNGALGVSGDITASSNAYITGVLGVGTADTGTAKLAVIGGNVGIGTTLPTSALHVVGSGYFSTNLNIGVGLTTPAFTMVTGAGASKVFTSDASGNASWSDITTIGIGGSGSINYLPKFTAGTTLGNSLIYDDNTNVGIGTTVPAALLSVGATSQFVINSSGYLGIGTTNPNDYAEIGGGVTIGSGYLGSNTAPANGLLVQGLVGIGTTSPTKLLDVVGGDIRTDSDLIAGDATLGYGNDLSANFVTGKAKALNTDGYLNFDASYGSNVEMDPSTGDLSGYAFSDDVGWIAFGTGVDNAQGPVNVSLTIGVVTGKARVINTDTYIDFEANLSDVIVNLTTKAFSGYVFSDDIGWIDFSDTGVTFDSPATLATSSTNQGLLINPNGTGSVYFQNSGYHINSTGDLTLGSNLTFSNDGVKQIFSGNSNLAIMTGSGYLGIGTTSPAALLSVGSTSQLVINSSGYLGIGTTNPNDYAEIGGGVTIGSGYLGSGTAPANGLLVQGNIGIGTTNPAVALEIGGSGNVRIGGLTASSGVYTDTNKTLTSTPPTSGILGFWQKNGTILSQATITDNLSIGSTAPVSATLYVPGSTNSDAWINLGTGHLGIGTTSPGAYALDVAGSTNTTSLYLSGTQVTSTATELNFLDGTTVTAGGLIFGDGTKLTNDASHLFWDDSANRLGIGTTLPTSKLTMIGNADITNQITSGLTAENPTYIRTGGPNTKGLVVKGAIYSPNYVDRWIAGAGDPGGTNTLAYSSDGITWTGLGTSIFSTFGLGAAWNGTRWVATGNGTNTLAYSSDGITWTGLGTSLFSSYGYNIAWNGTRWVAVGSGTNTLAYSSDGLTWTGLGTSIFSEQGRGVAWNDTYWVAVGHGTNTIAYSSDGITWTGLGTSIFSGCCGISGKDVAWNGTRWVALGAAGTNTIAYSSDGITWTGLGASIFSEIGNGVAWNGTRWVAVGKGTNSIAYSSDGVIWTGLGASAFSSYGNDVAWNGTRFVAVGYGSNYAAYSSDGITWTGEGTALSDIGQGIASAPAPQLTPSELGVPGTPTYQAANLQEWQDYSGTILGYIDALGGLSFSRSTNSTTAYRFNNSSGTSILDIDSSNSRVGIGTTAPAALFSVGSTSQLVVNSSGYLGIGTTSPNDYAEIGGGVTIGSGYLGSSTAPANGLLVEGNVGIGTSSPAVALEIGGSGNVRIGGLTASSAVYTDADKTLTSTAPTSGILGFWQRNGTTLSQATITDNLSIGSTAAASAMFYVPGATNSNAWFNLGTGYLGVGTTSPTTKLEVLGTTTQLKLSYDGTYNTQFTVDSTGMLTLAPNGTTAATFSDTANTFALPSSFTAAGGVLMSYDLLMTNQTASNIRSLGPLILEAGESFESNDLTLKTYNQGSVVVSNADASTTAADLNGLVLATTETGIITTGTRNMYGINSYPTITAASTGGTTNLYGGYFNPQSTTSTTGSTTNIYGGYFTGTGTLTTNGTINRYGVYIANGTSDTTGTAKKYGLYVESPTGADNNYAAIFAGGNIGIGTTAPALALDVVGNARFSAVGSGAMANDLRITSDGTLTTDTSDKSVKTNITPLDDTLSGILKLNPVSFNWKENPDGSKDIGLIAQDVATVFPEVTFTNPTDGMMGVNYSKLSTLLIKAMQEQQAQIDSLKQQPTISESSDDLSAITARLDALEAAQSSQSSASAGTGDSGLLASLQTLYDNIVQITEALGLKNVNGELVVQSPMSVLGKTTLQDVTITGDLTAGMLTFNSLENSLGIVGPACYNDATKSFNDTICNAQTLYVQKTLAGPVDFFNGAIVLQPNGDMKISGDLILAGRIKASESMRGTVTIEAGQGSVRIEKDWDSAPAGVVATSKFDARVWVSDVDKTGFTINVSDDLSSNGGEIYWVAIW